MKNNIQDFILNQARKDKIEITVYLTNGVPIKGKVLSFDNFTIVIDTKERMTMVYKHAITTVTPEQPIRLHIPEEESTEA